MEKPSVIKIISHQNNRFIRHIRKVGHRTLEWKPSVGLRTGS